MVDQPLPIPRRQAFEPLLQTDGIGSDSGLWLPRLEVPLGHLGKKFVFSGLGVIGVMLCRAFRFSLVNHVRQVWIHKLRNGTIFLKCRSSFSLSRSLSADRNE